MSTDFSNVETDVESSPQDPRLLHTNATVEEGKVPPVQTFPRVPQRPPQPPRNRWIVLVTALVLFALILSVGGFLVVGLIQRPASQVKPTPTTSVTTPTPNTGDITPTPPTGVTPGPQPAPPGIGDLAYWDTIIGTQKGVNQVESIAFANLVGDSSLQVLVNVRYAGTDARLDVYVFTDITNAHPQLLFKLSGLLKGDARISGYNTVMTAEADQNSSINKGKAVSALTPDLFREFQWSGGDSTFVQVAFPGLFPDLTRYQAEADQARINQGQDSWKTDPAKVSKALASQFFGWKRALTTKVLSGGGPLDVYATVRVQEAPVQGGSGQGPTPTVTVTLSRLEGNTHNMWVAIAVKDGANALTNIPARSQVASPVRLEGKGNAFENTIGMAYILDHLYTTVGRAIVTGTPGVGMGYLNYSILVSYDTSFKTGPQEGIVEVQLTSPVESDPYTAVMVKVLLVPQSVVAQGPISCPLVTQQPGFWESVTGIDRNTSSMGTVSCANMKGDPSLQALVPVFYNNGTSAKIYVYDRLTDAHPVQVFKLQTASAMISNYSTIITADIDQNSSINKDKSGDQLTTDLFREFKWSASAGTFVQVAFPGIFPDLTRWQAEQDQLVVNQGQSQDKWKNDPAQVALNLAVQIFKWSSSSQTTILSGGGAKDVNAVVQVKSAAPAHSAVKVTLSRLEGNMHNMWVAISVNTDNMSLTSPQKWAIVTSPVTVKGTGGAFEGDVGTVFMLDHLYTDIGHAKGVPKHSGITNFTATVSYTTSYHGVQEGVLAYYTYSMADGSIGGVVLEKELISG